MMVLTKSVNPENVSTAIEGLTIATVAILATLRIRFAKAITLGSAIGDVLNKIFSPFTSKLLDFGLSDDYEKWIPVRCAYSIVVTLFLPELCHAGKAASQIWGV